MKNPTFENFFQLLCEDGNGKAARWMAGETENYYTYAQLRERTYVCAGQIEKRNIGEAGGWAGLSVDTCPDWPVLFWGLIAAGRNVLLLDASLDEGKTAYLMRQAGATALITRKKAQFPFPAFDPELPLAPGDAIENPVWAANVAFCTSGTTSTSHVYCYDARALCENVVGIVRRQYVLNPVTRQENGPLSTLCFLPLHHIFGFLTNMFWTSFIGYPQVFLKDRAPETVLSTCRALDVAFIMTVPLLVNNIAVSLGKKLREGSIFRQAAFAVLTFFSLFSQRINPERGLRRAKKMFRSVNRQIFGDSLVQIVVGGSHMPSEHLRVVNALGYSVICGYGMTEIGVPSANADIALSGRLSGACGAAFEMAEYKIAPDGDDKRHGELLVKSRSMHMGQFVDGSLVPPDVDEDGYYHTGDIARMDKTGNLWIEGRIKDVVVNESGENVYPDELEDAFGDIKDADQLCVLGAKLSGDYEQPTLVLSVGSKYADEAFLAALSKKCDKCNRSLPMAKRVRRILVTSSRLPVVNSVKIKRVELRRLLEGRAIPYRELQGGAASIESAAEKPASTLRDDAEIRAQVRALVAAALEKREAEISDDARIMEDLGGDSLQCLSLSLKAEDKFGVQIPESQYARCATVRGMTDLIIEMLEEKNIKL